MRSTTATVLRALASLVAACAVLTLVVVGVQAANAGTTASTAPVADSTGSTGSTGTPTPPSAEDRARLRADLKAARKLSGTERKDALAAIRAKAEAGDYGPVIQRRFEHRAERRADRRQVVFALLPTDLQNDLKNLRQLPADQRPAARKQIVDDAAAGKYGDQVAAAVTKWRDLHHR